MLDEKSAKPKTISVDGKKFGFKYIVQKSNWIVSNCTIQVINISCWNDRERERKREWNIRSDCFFFFCLLLLVYLSQDDRTLITWLGSFALKHVLHTQATDMNYDYDYENMRHTHAHTQKRHNWKSKCRNNGISPFQQKKTIEEFMCVCVFFALLCLIF